MSSTLLEGEPLPGQRNLFMCVPRNWPSPVMEWRRSCVGAFGRLDVVRIRNGIFGLAENPRLRCMKVPAVMQQLGFREARPQTCVFMAFNETDGRLRGYMSVYADDGLAAGDVSMKPTWTASRRAGPQREVLWTHAPPA